MEAMVETPETEGSVEEPTSPAAPAEPHPLEAWAEPGAAIEPRIRRVLPGGGHLDASKRALKILEADMQRVASLPPVRHASEIAAERAAREAAAEDARLAAPDPPPV